MLFPLQHSSWKIPGHVDGRALSKGCMVLLKLWGKIYIYIYVSQRDPCMLSDILSDVEFYISSQMTIFVQKAI